MRIEQVKSKEEELSVYYEQLTMGNKMLCLQAINRFWLDLKVLRDFLVNTGGYFVPSMRNLTAKFCRVTSYPILVIFLGHLGRQKEAIEDLTSKLSNPGSYVEGVHSQERLGKCQEGQSYLYVLPRQHRKG